MDLTITLYIIPIDVRCCILIITPTYYMIRLTRCLNKIIISNRRWHARLCNFMKLIQSHRCTVDFLISLLSIVAMPINAFVISTVFIMNKSEWLLFLCIRIWHVTLHQTLRQIPQWEGSFLQDGSIRLLQSEKRVCIENIFFSTRLVFYLAVFIEGINFHSVIDITGKRTVLYAQWTPRSSWKLCRYCSRNSTHCWNSIARLTTLRMVS